MKSEKRFNFHQTFVVGAFVIGVGFFLFSLIFTRVIDKSKTKTTEMGIAEQKRKVVLQSPGRSTVHSTNLPSQADIEAAIAALENLDVTERGNKGIESSGDAANSETLFTDYSDETPLSYEEKRKQRRERIKNSPEFKAILEESRAHALEWNAWSGVERPAKDAYHEYMRNPYSVFGLTKDEGFETELSDKELELMKREGERLRQEAENEYAQWKAVWEEYKLEQREFGRQLQDMLNEK